MAGSLITGAEPTKSGNRFRHIQEGLKEIPVSELKMLVQAYGLGLPPDYEDVRPR